MRSRPSNCRPASCRVSAACTSSSRRPRWSDSAKARATSSSIRTAASSSARPARSSSPWPPISAMRSSLPGIDARDLRPRVQSSLKELEKFQCPSGGFAFWPGECQTVSPYLTSYVLSVYQTAATLNYTVDADVMRAGVRLSRKRDEPRSSRSTRAGGRPTPRGRHSRSRCSSTAAATRTRTSTGCISYLDRMPVFALAYLHDAMAANGGRGAAPGRAAPADEQRDPAGGGHGSCRGAERSVSVVVLQLQHPHDGASC